MEPIVQISVIGAMLITILIGTPIWVAFFFAGAFVLLVEMRIPFDTLAQFAFATVDSYALLAIPFFVLSGLLLVHSGGMHPLRIAVGALVARNKASLPVLVVFVAALLGAISGSSVACMAIMAAVLLPLFQTAGLSRAYGAGLIAVSSELGLIIPPSVFLIVFGASNQVSIGGLFIGGFAAGLFLTLCMLPVAVYTVWKNNLLSAASTTPAALPAETREADASFWEILPILLFPVVILGGIYGGFISPTESASVAVIYSLVLGVLVYRKLTVALFLDSLVDTVKLSSLVYLLLFGADMLSRLLSYLGIPSAITSMVLGFDLGPMGFMFTVTLLLLVLGLFFSSLPMIVVVLPLFLPTVRSLGIDPVYFGVVGVICAALGGLTPPFSPQLWLAEPICGVPMGQILRSAIPFLLSWVVGIGLMLIFPQIIEFPVTMMQ